MKGGPAGSLRHARGPGTAWRFALPSLAETGRFASALAALCGRSDALGLGGALGSGKTAFARAFIAARARAAGMPPPEVPSPTFTLIQTYEIGSLEIHHIDLYRLETPEETRELGIDDALAGGLGLIEWPERLGAATLPALLRFTFEQGPAEDARVALVDPPGDWPQRLGGRLDRWRA